MAVIDDISVIVNRLTGGNSGTPDHASRYWDNRVDTLAATNTVQGRLTSLWQYEGAPAGGAAPGGTVRVPTNATDGAYKQANPGGGREKWLLSLNGWGSSGGSLIIVDRLLDISGFAADATTTRTVGGTLTRNTGGLGNLIIAEIYTIVGTTATTITASYTNQAGTSGRTSTATAFGGTGLREAQRAIILPLQSGDTGVQACASCALAATTGTAGDYGITIARKIAQLDIPAGGGGAFRDLISGTPAIIEVDTDACLAAYWVASGTAAPQAECTLHMIEV